mgnify:CR=1 FL=1
MILNHYGTEQKVIKLNLIYIKKNKTKFIQDFENNLIKRMQGKIEIKVTSLSHKKKFSSHEQLMHRVNEGVSEQQQARVLGPVQHRVQGQARVGGQRPRRAQPARWDARVPWPRLVTRRPPIPRPRARR